MSKNENCFLTKRNDIYYFRARVPSALSSEKKEIKLSLKTKIKSEARKRARPLTAALLQLKAMSDTEKLLQQLRQLGVNTNGLSNYTIKGLSVGNTRIDELTVDSDNPNDVKAAQNALEAILGANSSHGAVVAETTTREALKLSDGINKYVEHKTRSSVRADVKDSWSDKTRLEYEQCYSLLVDIVGDVDLSEFDFDLAEEVREKLLLLPASISKIAKYKGLNIDEIIELGDKPRSLTTVNKVLGRYSALFKYLASKKDVTTNFFVGLQLESNTTDRARRRSYTNDELVRLFSYLNSIKLRDHQYWCVRIALLSGLRLEEIIQLHVSDIKFIDNIGLFDINDDTDKKIKTNSSRRLVPIHNDLIAAGFIEYVNKQKAAKHVLLFPECDKKIAGRRSHATSRWFVDVREKLGWTNLTPKLDFHSFRSTVATMLQRADVSEYDAACLLGHKFGKSESYGRYSETSELVKLRDAINLIKYDFVDI